MDENQQPQQPQQPAAPELTVADLNNLRSVLDIAVRRGAFQATELSSVGAVFDKLNAFVNALGNQQMTEKNKTDKPE
jgi:hypothetical protein